MTAVTGKISEFLQIPPFESLDTDARNVTLVRSGISKWLYSAAFQSRLSGFARKSIPRDYYRPFSRQMHRIMQSFGRRPPAMTSSDRAFLVSIYEEEISRLEQCLDWDLSSWRQVK